MNLVKKYPNVILFIDEIHMFLGAGAGSEDGQSCGNMIKPYITRGEVQIIGATTAEEYTRYIKKDKAFERRFHEVKIEEPTDAATMAILEGLLPVESEYFKRDIQKELVERVVHLSAKYTLDQANPAKAINMLELACAYSKVFEENNTKVDLDDIINSIQLKYNIYISKHKIEDSRKMLFDVLVGQDDALNQILHDLKIVDRGVVDRERPMMSMLLCGPTGKLCSIA